MIQQITEEDVQQAMLRLDELGERVSRRNVRSITGGGMSTVHKLMSRIEDRQSQQALVAQLSFSEALQRALQQEIEQHVRQATHLLHEQLQRMKEREQETLQNLTDIEEQAERLREERDKIKQKADQHSQQWQTSEAVMKETVSWQEGQLETYEREHRQLIQQTEQAHAEASRAQGELEQARKAARKYESQADDQRQL